MKDVAAGVVLVHGAWHGAWCWDGVVAELERRRVPASAVELLLSGFDVAAARQAIEESRPATVVVGHSDGGAVISAAASGLSSVSHLVYVSAFVPVIGEDTAALLAAHGSRLDSLVITDDGVAVDREAARGLFFGDTDEETARALVARLRSDAPDGMAVLRCEPAWRSVPSMYLRCTRGVPAGGAAHGGRTRGRGRRLADRSLVLCHKTKRAGRPHHGGPSFGGDVT